MGPLFIGYDGREYALNSRVELSPHLDLWMRGARYGTVARFRVGPNVRVFVKVDKLGARQAAVMMTEDCVRAVP